MKRNTTDANGRQSLDEKFGAMLVGMDFVAREINFYTIFEVY